MQVNTRLCQLRYTDIASYPGLPAQVKRPKSSINISAHMPDFSQWVYASHFRNSLTTLSPKGQEINSNRHNNLLRSAYLFSLLDVVVLALVRSPNEHYLQLTVSMPAQEKRKVIYRLTNHRSTSLRFEHREILRGSVDVAMIKNLIAPRKAFSHPEVVSTQTHE